MTTFQGILFAALIVMVLVWFYCVRSLALQLLQRHPDIHEVMDMSQVWEVRRYGNAKAVYSMLRFLARKEYLALDDPGITSLSVFMRWLLVIYIGAFGYLAFTITQAMPTQQQDSREAVSGSAAAEVRREAVTEERRQAAYDLHRELKWPQAIAAYDSLLRDSGDDAEILFWRGMAHWKSAHFDEALRDFQRVADLDPRHLEAHRNADRLLSRQKRWDEILAMWDRYIAHQPRDAEAYFERGGTFFQKGSIEAARADAKKACELGKVQACTMVERLKDR